MKIEIIDAKPYHIGRMVRILRNEQKSIIVGLGINVHREIFTCYDNSSYRKACLADGRLAAVWGVMGTALETEGVIWLVLAQWATAYPFAIIKRAKQQMAHIFELKERVATIIFSGDNASYWFARQLGFEKKYVVDEYNGVYMEAARWVP